MKNFSKTTFSLSDLKYHLARTARYIRSVFLGDEVIRLRDLIRKLLHTSVLGKRISLIVLGDAISVVAILLSGMILARVMTQDQMGTYRQIQYLAILSAAMIEFGASTSIYRFWNELGDHERIIYIKMLMIFALVAGSLATLVIIGLAPLFAKWFNNPDLGKALIICSLYPVSAIPLMFLRPVLISSGYSIIATSLEALLTLIPIIAILIPLFLGASFTVSLAIWMAACLIRLIMVPIVLRHYLFRESNWWSMSLLKKVFNFLWPIQLSRVPGLIMSYLDKIVMAFLLQPKAFAIYSMGAREIPLIGGIGPSVSSALIPSLVEDLTEEQHDQICRKWRKACLKTATLIYPITAFCIVYAVPVMEFLFSSIYRESSLPFSIFAGISFIRIIEYGNLAKVYNQTGLILRSTIFSSVVMVFSAFTLTWLFGVAGMASSVLINWAADAAYLLVSYRKLLNRPLTKFFPLPGLAILMLLSFTAAAIGSGLFSYLIPITEERMLALGWKLAVHFGATGLAYLILLSTFPRLVPSLAHCLRDV